MVRPNLVRYIQDNLSKGFSIHEIKHGLLAQGISDYEINEAMKEIREPTKLGNFSSKRIEFQQHTPKRGLKLMIGIFVIFVFIFLFLFFLIKAERPLKSEIEISQYSLLKGVDLELVEGSKVMMEYELQEYTIFFNNFNGNYIDLSGDVKASMYLGDIVSFDLNGDYASDLIIGFKDLNKREILISLEGIDNSVCEEEWICSDWSSCIDGFKKRVCLDINYCETELFKPELQEICGEIPSSVINFSSNFSALNCSDFVLPDCGEAYPNDVSDVQKKFNDGSSITFPNYDEDCSLVCFGENLLSSCEEGNVTLRDGLGSLEVLYSKGVINGSCKLEYKVIEENPSEPGSAGTYLRCPVPMDEIYELSCVDSACLEEGMPGQTTMGVLTYMVLDALFNPETECNGTMIDYLMGT
jgi:hypothetical protein